MKALLGLSVIVTALAILSNAALASPPDCEAVCTCARYCSTACSILGSSQPTTCEAVGLACMESCPDDQLDGPLILETSRYSDEDSVSMRHDGVYRHEELVCRLYSIAPVRD